MPSPSRSLLGQPLTETELSVVRAIVEVGASTDRLAFHLRTTPDLIKTHLRYAAIKLGTDRHVGLPSYAGGGVTAAATVAAAFRKGLLDDVTALAQPDDFWRNFRRSDPYVFRDPGGNRLAPDYWQAPRYMRGPA